MQTFVSICITSGSHSFGRLAAHLGNGVCFLFAGSHNTWGCIPLTELELLCISPARLCGEELTLCGDGLEGFDSFDVDTAGFCMFGLT
jgi:hypothetical protein